MRHMDDDPVALRDVCSNNRCPNCANPNLRRTSLNGGSGVWEFFERCRCGYELHYEDVMV